MTKMNGSEKRIWGSGLEYVLAAALESGMDQIEIRLSCSGVTGEPEAHNLMSSLAKCGAHINRSGETLTAVVDKESANGLLRKDHEQDESMDARGASRD